MESALSPRRLNELANSQRAENKQLFKKLKRLKPDTLDKLFHEAHGKEFEKFSCLTCANCCKTISPIITFHDVERMAKALRQKPSVIVDEYLELDSDGDFVFRVAPCPFLQPDNRCMIYGSRPKACREYPHTDRKRMHGILGITLKNVEICPVVYGVVERIKAELRSSSSN
ncbi:MAG: YkgJ family cysteine cluster protein [Tenuifilaceae bacterium]|jgi:hypothetical protein|nr:YkgJ family cysteine cluster protein [Bacteroidales bacterium]MDI9516121.1 YkgJ family cysteine cluster protein [Bacteroidota bacterium]NLH57165.1 YkgJ family cysteine cluster protein [Rikenellaceae bacterium]OQC63783.1 MAG: Flagellin N-methylase [Bacteroidetes bacterium ADurb.Bin008]HNV82509.1 YkgJ family cysteine cluster protein [Tenuifilaceae bacterium]